jgi:ribosomal protein S18 acetylase RimI-like enzyme
VPYAYLYELSIEEPFRRRGFGRQAIALAAARCRELGISRLVLHVFAHNPAAIALYEQCGFAMTDHWMALAIRPAT